MQPITDDLSLYEDILEIESSEGPVAEFIKLIQERYENFPVHPVCVGCKLGCSQTTAPGLYYFKCCKRQRK